MSEFIGKKHEFEGYIFMCLQGVTGGVELGGDIAVAVLRPVRPAVGEASYHLVDIKKCKYNRTDVVLLFREGDLRLLNVMIVILSDHGYVYLYKINSKRIQVRY